MTALELWESWLSGCGLSPEGIVLAILPGVVVAAMTVRLISLLLRPRMGG